MSLQVTEEAIAAMKAANTQFLEVQKELLGYSKALLLTYGDNKDGLGRHNQSIETLLQQLVETSGDEKEVKKLVKKLTRSCNTIAAHIEHDLYGGKSR